MSSSPFRFVAVVLANVGILWPVEAPAQTSEETDPRDASHPTATHPDALWSLTLSTRPGRAVDVRYVDEGVAGYDLDGRRVWTIHHSFAGQTMTTESADYPRPDFDPIVDGRFAYYATAADLLMVDVPAGRIVDRTRFPAAILDITRVDDHLAVELGSWNALDPSPGLREDAPAWEQPWRLTVPHVPGTAAPQGGPAEVLALYTTQRDASLSTRVADGKKVFDLSDDFLRERIRTLQLRQRRDPTNPFLTLYRGRLHKKLNEHEHARRAFRRAAERPTSHWMEALSLAFNLAGRISHERVELLVERGLQQMRQTGLDPRQLTALVWVSAITRSAEISDQLEEAFQLGDVERADRLGTLIARVFPHGEMGQVAYAKYAEWFRRQGRPDLAEQWDRRAREARGSLSHHVYFEAIRTVDFALLAGLTALLALLSLAAATGVRIGERAASTASDREDSGWHAIGAVRWTDGLSLLLLTGVIWGAISVGETAVATIDFDSDSPVDLGAHAFWTPTADAWLEHLEPSGARDTWLQYARDRQEALRQGLDAPRPSPPVATLAKAVRHTAASRPGGDDSPRSLTRRFPGPEWLMPSTANRLLGWLGPALFLFLGVGFFGGWLSPTGTAWSRWAIPGAAGGPLTAPIFLMVTGPIVALLTGVDETMLQMSVPVFDAYYHLGAVEIPFHRSRWWAYLALPAGLVLHIGTNVYTSIGRRNSDVGNR